MKSRRPFLWISTAALAIVLIGALLLSRRYPKPPPPREVPAHELTLREGRSYWKDETTPFTGAITETYPAGTLKSRSALSNGVMHGLSEGWYTNGVMQVREHFVEGISHGPRAKWYESGAKLSETGIKHGQINGAFRRWHENGNLAEELTLTNGQPDGLSVAYYPSGFVKATARHVNGKLVEQNSWKDGEMQANALAAKKSASPKAD